MSDIIELIDNAVWDTWESPDAMRWSPEPPEEMAPVAPGPIVDEWIERTAGTEVVYRNPGLSPLDAAVLAMDAYRSPLEVEVRRRAERWAFGPEHFHNPPGFAFDVMVTDSGRGALVAAFIRDRLGVELPPWQVHFLDRTYAAADEVLMRGNAYVPRAARTFGVPPSMLVANGSRLRRMHGLLAPCPGS